MAAAAFITNEEECQKTAQVPAGTICMYDCIEGYLVVGSPAIECTDSGFWNESAPRCDSKLYSNCIASSLKLMDTFHFLHFGEMIVETGTRKRRVFLFR